MTLDLDRLTGYLKTKLPGVTKIVRAEKFPGGQSNPTYKLSTDSGPMVLRAKPQGEILKSAHAIDREFTVLRALASSQVPVGKVFHFCTDSDVIGSEFYVMEYLNGTVYWDPMLPDLSVEHRSVIYDQMNTTLVAIHSVDIEHAGLDGYGGSGNYYERQIARWVKQYRASETHTIASMDTLIEWLGAQDTMSDDRQTLVHGDYRLDNLMFATDGITPIAVMDWELSTLGHPFADLAYQCMQWRLPVGAETKGLKDVDRARHGIPIEKAYVEHYCDRMYIKTIDNWPFYLAFSYFRLGAILQGVYKRSLQGNASNENALRMGRLASLLADDAVKMIESEA